jgi:hypothetical protein
MNKVIAPVWEWLDRPGLEAASVCFSDDGMLLEAVGVTVFDATPLRFRYKVLTDSTGQVRNAAIKVEWQGATKETQLARDQLGWTVDGASRPDLAGCIDIDFMGSPSTNTLPIHRFAWVPGESRDFRMAYIRLPDLAVMAMAQRYTFLAHVQEQRRFEYCSLESAFRAQILVDGHDLVVEYPSYWRRYEFV